MIYSADDIKLSNPTKEEIEQYLVRDCLIHAFAPGKHQVAICLLPESQIIRVYVDIFGSEDFSRSDEKNETSQAIDHFLELVKTYGLEQEQNV